MFRSPAVAPKRLLLAWLAMLALCVQGLSPAAALAAEAEGRSIVICTADGAKTLHGVAAPGSEGQGFAGLKCADCVFASLAGVTPVAAAVPVSYAYAALRTPAVRSAKPLGARAPPRPPSQGPPASSI